MATHTDGPRKGMLTVEEAAAYLGMPIKTFRKLYQMRKITHYRFGQRVYFRREHLDDWRDGQCVPAIR